jgi:hypothetical protein
VEFAAARVVQLFALAGIALSVPGTAYGAVFSHGSPFMTLAQNVTLCRYLSLNSLASNQAAID